MKKLLLFLGVMGMGAQAQAQDCAKVESTADRLACYDASARSSSLQSTATVTGTVTWQYSDYIGTKGDVGAKVFLVPHPLNVSLEKLKSHSDLYLEGALSIYGSEIGGYKTKADGYGKFSVSGVQSGTYDVLIVSKKARTYPDGEYNAFCQSKYDSYTTGSAFQFKKVSCKTIIVRTGLDIMHSHDFGHTER